MAKKKRAAHKKPNVFKGSYDVASGKIEIAKSLYRTSKSESRNIVRRELHLNTFPYELRRFGIITGIIVVILIICTIVFNLV